MIIRFSVQRSALATRLAFCLRSLFAVIFSLPLATYTRRASIGKAILYTTTTTTTTTTTQRGWCIEVFVSILTHLQSQKLLPGGGGV